MSRATLHARLGRHRRYSPHRRRALATAVARDRRPERPRLRQHRPGIERPSDLARAPADASTRSDRPHVRAGVRRPRRTCSRARQRGARGAAARRSVSAASRTPTAAPARAPSTAPDSSVRVQHGGRPLAAAQRARRSTTRSQHIKRSQLQPGDLVFQERRLPVPRGHLSPAMASWWHAPHTGRTSRSSGSTTATRLRPRPHRRLRQPPRRRHHHRRGHHRHR